MIVCGVSGIETFLTLTKVMVHLSCIRAQQLTRICNAGFNDAFIVPTVAGGVP